MHSYVVTDRQISRGVRTGWCPGIITTGQLETLGHMKFSISNQKQLSKIVIERLTWGSVIILAHHPMDLCEASQTGWKVPGLQSSRRPRRLRRVNDFPVGSSPLP
jgi:hypothetical protein